MYISKSLRSDFFTAIISVGFSGLKEYAKTRYSRKGDIKTRRQIAIWLVNEESKKYSINGRRKYSLESIGLVFGKDHATVSHSINIVNNLIQTKDKKYYPLILEAIDNFKALKMVEEEKKTPLVYKINLIGVALKSGMEVEGEVTVEELYSKAKKFLVDIHGDLPGKIHNYKPVKCKK